MAEILPRPGVYFQHNPFGRIPHLLRPILVAPEFRDEVAAYSDVDCFVVASRRDFLCAMDVNPEVFHVRHCSKRAGTEEPRVFDSREYKRLPDFTPGNPDVLRFARLFHYCNSVAGRQEMPTDQQLIVVVYDPLMP